MKNKVIEVLNKEHGKKVIEYWKSVGVDTLAMRGGCTRDRRYNNRYYGVINDGFGSYTIDDVWNANAEIIELPKEEKPFPRVMLVSDDGDFWYKRVVLMQKCDRFLAWNNAETIEESECVFGILPWRYAKEIPEKVELTKSEIVEKFGVSVDQLVINDC